MSTWALAVCAILYLMACIDLARQRQYGLALAFLCYAIANVGLIMAARAHARW